MPKRDQKLYIEDVLDSAEAIKEFTKDLDFENFRNDRKTDCMGFNNSRA